MKLNYLFYTFIFLFSLIADTASAQYEATLKGNNFLHFNHLKKDVGVANMVAYDIYEDGNGFIWFSTETGLCRYDGTHIKYFIDKSNERRMPMNAFVFSQNNNKNIWISNRKNLMRFDANKEEFVHVRFSVENQEVMKDITSICCWENAIWLGTRNGLFSAHFDDYMCNKSGVSESSQMNCDSIHLAPVRFPTDGKVVQAFDITSLHAHANGQLWIGTKRHGLYVVYANHGACPTLTPIQVKEFEKDEIINVIRYDKERVLVVTSKGLYLMDTNFNVRLLLNNLYISTANVTSSGEIWCSTYGDGLFYFKNAEDSFENFRYFGEDNSTYNFISSSFVDSKDNFWIIPEKLGVRWLGSIAHYITNYTQLHYKKGLKNNIVKDISLDDEGNWYLATYFGVSIYDPKKFKFKHLQLSDIEENNEVESLYWNNDGWLWIGTRNGLYKYHTGNKVLKKVAGMDERVLWDLMPTRDKCGLWIGTDRGLYKLTFKNESLLHYSLEDPNEDEERHVQVFTILEDDSRRLLVGTHKKGLLKADLSVGADSLVFESYIKKDDPSNLYEPKVYSLHQSADQTIWVGTKTGLYALRKDGSIKKYTGEEGKAYNIIKSIKEDSEHRMWLTTHLGIAVLNPLTGDIRYFNTNDGINSDIFSVGASVMLDDDTFLAGSLKGLIEFDGRGIMKRYESHPLAYISSIAINNQSIRSDIFKDREFSEKGPRFLKEIEVESDENNISIEFGSIEMNHPNRIRWAYRIKELDPIWHRLPSMQNSIMLFNIPSGKYNLEYKSTNHVGKWNNQTGLLQIRVQNHWSRTPLAYFIYFLGFFMIILYIFDFQKRKIKEKEAINHERELNRQALSMEKEKIEFFTNISHELRTPMTLIAAPLLELKEKGHALPDEKISYYTELIFKNVKLLNRHIEQLLNFSKIQNGKTQLHLGFHNVAQLTRQAVNSFNALAMQKNISLRYTDSTTLGNVMCDPNAVEIILYNLLSNAIKYTHEGGQVEVNLTSPKDKKDYYCISVKDNGIGISASQQGEIFKRYTRLNNAEMKAEGIGIGLAYTKLLVDMHKGKISLESQLNKGSCFYVYLPVTMQYYLNKMTKRSLKKPTPPATHQIEQLKVEQNPDCSQEETLLIVEDNDDLRTFLFHLFSQRYRILTAVNGEEGLGIAKEHLPDIIISDIMMPIMDGVEMTKQLKNNFITSHIPIIILTAKSDIADEMEGLNSGANYYLKKPFLPNQLEMIVKNIHSQQLQTRTHLLKQLSNSVQQAETDEKVKRDEFLVKAESFVLENLSSPSLTVENLAGAMNLSTVHLYRKMKAAANMTPNDFIRDIRMKRAIEMLIKEHMNISEVAYAIGYNDPKYFSKCFKTMFGMCPSVYVKSKFGQ